MRFRKSNYQDIKEIMILINQAKEYLKLKGVNQWQDGYPNEEVIKEDIAKGESYILISNDKIVGTSTICFSGENTYDNIFGGEWLTKNKYIVMHRVAVHDDFKGTGIFRKILCEASKLSTMNNINSIKIDTHEDNLSMQKALINNGFKRCGIIYLENGDKRIAFEKIINR
ncbi:GNAT family N-acetyltransferase [Clostridium sp.]|uniref:GNAT family N-acetyltransferase n=1 Tax=Clostridium sp. TaxID=1506 RepID=UPI00261A897A|nr:GNAT family N-acetyltransferase [Clostridium sp.]